MVDDSAEVLRRPMHPQRIVMSLNAVHTVRLVQRPATGRAAAVDNDPAPRARRALDDLSVRLWSGGRSSRRNRVGRIVADDGSLVLLLAATMQAQAFLDRQQQATRRLAVARDLDQRLLVEALVDDRVGLAVLAEDVFRHVDSVLVSTLAEGAAFAVGVEGVRAARAVAGVALKLAQDEILVVVQVAHPHDGRVLGGLLEERHGGIRPSKRTALQGRVGRHGVEMEARSRAKEGQLEGSSREACRKIAAV